MTWSMEAVHQGLHGVGEDVDDGGHQMLWPLGGVWSSRLLVFISKKVPPPWKMWPESGPNAGKGGGAHIVDHGLAAHRADLC